MALLPGAIAWFIASLLSQVTSAAIEGNLSRVMNNAIQLVILLVISSIVLTAINTIKKNVVIQDKQKCKQLLYRNIANVPLNQAYMRNSGEILELLSDDFERVTGHWVESVPQFVAGITISVVYTILFLSRYHITVTLFMLGMAFIQLIPPVIVKRFMQINYEKTRGVEAEITSHIIAGCKGFDTISIYRLQSWFVERLKRLQKKYFKIGSSAEITVSAEDAMNELVTRLLKYGVYVANGFFALYGIIEITDAITIIAVSTEFFSSIRSGTSIIPSFAIEKTADIRLSDWQQKIPYGNDVPANSFVNFREVTYNTPTQKLFDGLTISLDLKKCSIIKGANGDGKSTLIRMIVGAICPDTGAVEIDGYSPIVLPRSVWTNSIFYLPQEDPLLQITATDYFDAVGIRDNAILMAEKFGLSSKLIKNIPICEMSGGERKKVFLSAALAKPDAVLLMDEPTNGLDIQSRKANG